MRVEFSAELVMGTHGNGTYLHVNMPAEETAYLRSLPVQRAGFSSIKVDASIGTTTWRTSIFPDKEQSLLLISKKVAKAEDLEVGEPVTVTIEVVTD
jgi:hypothetical protein